MNYFGLSVFLCVALFFMRAIKKDMQTDKWTK